jgi:uncharacterized membrane protein YphA (DoxX/SURF4 family)
MTNKNKILRIFLGIVFFSAGIYRAVFWKTAMQEFSRFPEKISVWLAILVIILEIWGGILLILNKKIRLVLAIFAIFLSLAILQITITNLPSLVNNFAELFSFNPTPTNIFLHLTYLLILISLLFSL